MDSLPFRVPIPGGQPTVGVDVPISAALMTLFACSAAIHMTIFVRNVRRRPRRGRFALSVPLCGLSLARLGALGVRIIWAARPVSLGAVAAASSLWFCGVAIAFVVNVLLAHRIAVGLLVRTYPGAVGPAAAAVRIVAVSAGPALVIAVVSTAYSFFAAGPGPLDRCRIAQIIAAVWLTALAAAPLPALGLAGLLPRPAGTRQFGAGGMRAKILLVASAAALLTLGAVFRAVIVIIPRARRPQHQGWYYSRACYYGFNYAIELVVLYGFAIGRVDRRFCVRNWRTVEPETEETDGSAGEPKSLTDGARQDGGGTGESKSLVEGASPDGVAGGGRSLLAEGARLDEIAAGSGRGA